MSSVLGEACGSPVTIDVVGVSEDNWLVRSRYLNDVPTKLIAFINREKANEFAEELRDLTSEMSIRLHGFPAKLELAEAPDVP